MAEQFTADLLFILFVLLIAALLGFLIGWFLAIGRCKKRIAELEAEIEGLKTKIRSLEDDKNALDVKLHQLDDEKNKLLLKASGMEEDERALRAEVRNMDDVIASLKLTIDRLEKDISMLKAQLDMAAKPDDMHEIADLPTVAAMTEFSPENIKPDDLRVVNGIGPKIAQLLINRGISTWKALSETSPNYLTVILHEDGGERFRIHNPDSWPHQARLLYEGRWDEFRELLNRLEGENN